MTTDADELKHKAVKYISETSSLSDECKQFIAGKLLKHLEEIGKLRQYVDDIEYRGTLNNLIIERETQRMWRKAHPYTSEELNSCFALAKAKKKKWEAYESQAMGYLAPIVGSSSPKLLEAYVEKMKQKQTLERYITDPSYRDEVNAQVSANRLFRDWEDHLYEQYRQSPQFAVDRAEYAACVAARSKRAEVEGTLKILTESKINDNSLKQKES